MKNLVVVLMMLCVGFTYAQKERTLKFNKSKQLIEVVYYYDNGNVSQTGYYTTDGKLHGDWFSYSQEGEKTVAAKYNKGKKVGKWFYWSNNELREVNYSENSVDDVSEWVSKEAVASN